jgi:predicted transcriptional regulator
LKYRSQTDIVARILEGAASGPATKTKLFYASYLSFDRFTDYLSIILEKHLLEFLPDRRRYHTTTKGEQYLATYGEMNTLSGIIDALKKDSETID